LARANAVVDDFQQISEVGMEQWRLASADLTLVLRLDPTVAVVPLEPPSLRVTLFSPGVTVDELIPIALVNRPELASQQALVQATLARIKQERMRSLIPSLVMQGGGGVFASELNSVDNPTRQRNDVSVNLIWGLDNLGLGNRARVRERRAENDLALTELLRIQDRVAAEVVRAQAQVELAQRRINLSEQGLIDAHAAYVGSYAEWQSNKDGEVRRAFEVVDALRALSRAYDNYYSSVHDYNRSQFQLYRALGYPAEGLTCNQLPGNTLPVDSGAPRR
jgi:outer membrane protein TolC